MLTGLSSSVREARCVGNGHFRSSLKRDILDGQPRSRNNHPILMRLEVSTGGACLVASLAVGAALSPALFGSFLVALLVHECGHLICAQWVGIKVKAFGVNGRGLYLRREAGSPSASLQVALAGPLANLFVAMISPSVALANLVLAISNLIPLFGSDGDHALDCLAKSWPDWQAVLPTQETQ